MSLEMPDDSATASKPLPPQPSSSPTANDVVTRITGDFGRWQLRTVLLVFLCKIPHAWFMACVIYTAPTPQKGDYFCKPPPVINISEQLDWVRMSYPVTEERPTDRRFHVDACNIYEENAFAARYPNYTNPFQKPHSSHTDDVNLMVNVIPCQKFEHTTGYTSLVTQFDLVCSRQLLVSVTQSFHCLGTLIGGLIAVQALKHPRKLMLIGMLFQMWCGNLTGLMSTFHLHVFFRCLTSIFCTLMYTSGQVILNDITGGKAQTIVIALSELFWSMGLVLLPGISIFFDSWSYLYVVISSSVIVLVFLHRWIADSPRWLLRRDKIDDALQILLESAAFNNREIPLNLASQLEAYAGQLRSQKQPSYWSIWDGRTDRMYIISIHLAWVWAGMLSNVMLLMIRQLGVEHIHVNTASMGFAEMIGVLLGLLFILFTRRRWLWAGYITIVAGVLTHFVWLVPPTIKENRRVGMQLIFWICLKLANSASHSVLSTCTGEMVSAAKRPMLMLSVVTYSRFWLVLGPFISTLTVIHQLIPITIFAALAVLNGALMCFLNRTFWNQDQPRIEKVLTPNTYRRNSSILLLRRSSTCSEVSSDQTLPAGYDNPLSISSFIYISISDLWNMDARFGTIEEYDSSTEVEKEKETINF